MKPLTLIFGVLSTAALVACSDPPGKLNYAAGAMAQARSEYPDIYITNAKEFSRPYGDRPWVCGWGVENLSEGHQHEDRLREIRWIVQGSATTQASELSHLVLLVQGDRFNPQIQRDRPTGSASDPGEDPWAGVVGGGGVSALVGGGVL
jgi:hypothetical protein